ncbi:uncharacterized protein LOC122521983 [Polistes fuscatus]|uniref:uncharacterized protein LOC122521983 n=1 Tax=Polistes fuscatus TaxID=30207 RepID=UPI001CA95FF9|nr:uncharacterized protein LOC122521983 [Polistes fuscatus]
MARAAFTKAYNTLNALLDPAKGSSRRAISNSLAQLESKTKQLTSISQSYLDLRIEGDDYSEAEIEQETNETVEYEAKFFDIKSQVEDLFKETESSSTSALAAVALPVQPDIRVSCNLPMIWLHQLSGNIEDWLPFWSSFKKVHKNSGLTKEDKFQYSIQSMEPKPCAAALIKSYSPTAENYTKAIDSLMERYGDTDLQIEVYIRQLLQLVLRKPARSTNHFLSGLYENLESRLRALESLGLTNDTYATIMYPLVESALPEELLRAWQRSCSLLNANYIRGTGGSTIRGKGRLTRLMEFLAMEVKSKMKVSLAMEEFLPSDNREKDKTSRNRPHMRDVLSAASLLTANKGKRSSCVFCGSSEHGDVNCEIAKNMSLREKREHARKCNTCSVCLKFGHHYKRCFARAKYDGCSRRHVTLMCPVNEKDDTEKEETKPKGITNNKGEININECSLASYCKDAEVLMPTLRAKLRNGNKEINVRLIIDSGSQKSYITKGAVHEMGYEPIGEQTMGHLLFGGRRTETVCHKKYRVHLGDLDDTYRCNFVAMDQEVICEKIPRVKSDECLGELKKLKIHLSDTQSDNHAVSLLVGADILGKLFTGRCHQLKNGLAAIETRLGWTVLGKVPSRERRNDAVGTAISMFIENVNVSDLWSLDILGIRDPIENKSHIENENEIKASLLKTVVINEEGRYEVGLPWKENHPPLRDNKEIAHRHLQSAIKKLKDQGLYQEYDVVFNDWLNEGIIEQLPIEEEKNWGHYLPHRGVLKESSTTRLRPVFNASARGKNSVSLNECLHVGPNLIELIPTPVSRSQSNETKHPRVSTPSFYPLGFVCSALLLPRLLLQETWNQKLNWDDDVPYESKQQFLLWVDDLINLKKIRIPRCFLGEIEENSKVSIHTFCDASSVAYAAVVYIRVESPSGVKIYFAQAKNRIAPVKKEKSNTRLSIPRLELLAAVTGVRLTISLLDSLDLGKVDIYYWSDSSTVLAWIQRNNNWGTFVFNRVKEIRKFSSPSQWHHVPGRFTVA